MEPNPSDNIEQLQQELQQILAYRIGDFRLEFNKNGLIIKGKARTFYAKQLAQHLTMEKINAPILANEIEVQ